ncbi:DUF6471 domain-containing protein [Paraburkholderia sp. SIMBA_049]
MKGPSYGQAARLHLVVLVNGWRKKRIFPRKRGKICKSHVSGFMSSITESQEAAGSGASASDIDFAREAKLALKAELERRGLTYKDLAGQMCAVGFTETPKSVAEKIGKGRFQFSFFLQCFYALGVDVVRVHVPARPDISIDLSRL